MPTQQVTCRRCGQAKPAERFRANHRAPGGRQATCLDCLQADHVALTQARLRIGSA